MARAGLALALAVAALALPAAARATIVATPTAHAVFTLDSNGVLAVLQNLDVRADASTPASWEVVMDRGELFAQPSVFVNGRRYRPGDGRTPGTFLISRGTHGVRFDWLQPPGARSVRLGYRLALFGTAYTDIVDLHVPLWEEWPAPVTRLTAALELPRTPRRHVIVWVEPTSLRPALSTVGHTVRLTMREVDAKQAVTMHAVVPRGVVTSTYGLNVERRPGLASVLAARTSRRRTWWPWIVAAAAFVVLIAAVVLRRERSRRPLPR